jgi:hypothetical protein
MYLRNFSLQVGTGINTITGSGGQGLELSPDPSTMPKATFHIYSHTKETPNHAQIRVYNLSNDTVAQIQNEFVQITLSAGYIDNPYGIIFNGVILQCKVGYEGMGGIDSYIEIEAADGGLQYAKAIIAGTAAAGSSYQTRLNLISSAINNYGSVTQTSSTSAGSSNIAAGGGSTQNVSLGYTDPLPSGTAPRARVYYGMVRDHMRDFASSVNMDWFIYNGQIILLGKNNTLPNTTNTTLTPSTGLIGYPEQTEQGIKIRSLLNPNLIPGGQVNIQNSAVLQQTLNTSINGSSSNSSPNNLTPISPTGNYKIIFVEHYGDTRGNEWYTDLTCVAVGAPTPNSITSQIGGITPGYTAPY